MGCRVTGPGGFCGETTLAASGGLDFQYDFFFRRQAIGAFFGKKLLAKNLDAASEWSKNANMDAVTMDGDEVNRKGALQVGFIDNDKSKLASHDQMKKSQGKLDKLKKQKDLFSLIEFYSLL